MEKNVAYLGGLLWIPHSMVDLKLLKARLTFTPVVTVGRSQPIHCWSDQPNHIGIPKYTFGSPGGLEFRRMFIDSGVPLVDIRPKKFQLVAMNSLVTLDQGRNNDRQRQAFHALMDNEDGILQLACGAGKSVIAIHAASQFKAPFLVIVNNKGLQEQWVKEIQRFLVDGDGKPIKVGRVGDGASEWDAPIVVALIQTLAKHHKDLPKEIRYKFAASIWDECDILGAPMFSKAAPLFVGRRWGLSATPKREDGLEQMYFLHVGKPIYTDLHQDMKPEFGFYITNYKINDNDPVFNSYVKRNGIIDVSALFSYLSGLRPRTEEIRDIILLGMQAGRKILVLSRRVFLLEELHRLIPESGLILGRTPGSMREKLTRTKDVLLTQLKLGEKAMNKPELDMLVLCEPVKRKEVFQQIVGRVQRSSPGKATPQVVFIEDRVGPCIAMCRRLKQVIRQWPEEQGGPFKWRYLKVEEEHGQDVQ